MSSRALVEAAFSEFPGRNMAWIAEEEAWADSRSYGIATPTAGSLEFQDVIPGALVEAAFSEFRDEIWRGLWRRRRGPDFGAGGIKSREGHSLVPPLFDRGVSGGYFPCSSYGIATLTAGSLEFQDVIPGPWLRQLLVNSGRNMAWIMEEEAWADFGAGGIKSREGHSLVPPLFDRGCSYGIATLTAGSLEFQDVIPGPWLRQLLVNSGTKYGVDYGGGGVGPHFGAGGIKSREGHSLVPPLLIAVGLQRLSRINDMG
ncbi:hypothetical protein OIU84_027362 [Salix udensis]|uniref:Uncharacterized protein n=1 Tax=Salix udensis TaxID=889485 RepID=A0AAD6KFB9_9ROSI|nr:hypothetical protein OIU84_027362 [Salix udensis]